ncbi:histidine kinase [Ruminococcus sp. OA3]|uniref:sensor histidine kinase n=1 Tax=Ruminococcus sp. OA3 TaxID=2914164 RepID=UPI001F067157|nr:histidine kinase [Ruminococcus sp. OA3]MCH1983282.1 histidine kinase [Ruminococcus sp. OA3]
MDRIDTGTSLKKRIKICAALLAALALLMTIYILFLLNELKENNKAAFDSGRTTGMILLLLLCGYLVFTYNYLVIPYLKTRRVLDNFNKGIVFEDVFSLPYPFTPELEIALAKLEALLDKKESLRLSVEQSKYLALQNQINPHFLYNTLDAIRGDVLMAGLHNISDTIEALSTYFAYSISNLEQYATLSEELRNVQAYITVQKYRFGEALQFSVIYEEDREQLQDLYIPRMVLQPIVENAIYHGLEIRNKRGNIQLRIQMTRKTVIIDIIDDGVGMSQKAVEVLNLKLTHAEAGLGNAEQKRKGIALVNVNSRIKLLFGHEFGMYVYSNEGVGTDVKLTLPIVKEPK